ncbi:glycosyltransferase family 2 protein [Natronomonas amylolytica]|uniref:glycosyltransferase family 2 protein n=1 Tax=Natronomonas amylolytica TaxID=3108498 RepID=UPI00300AD74E
MVEISIVIPTLKPRDEIEAVQCLERGTFEDFEVIVRDDVPVTRARNEGIKRASADKLVFLDDDSCPTRNYLQLASEILDREAAFAGRTIHPRDDVFARHFTGHYDWGDSPQYVQRFWGNNMGARRDVFDAVGGWDENMGWGHEEKELANRVIQKFDIRYHPDLVVYHPYAESVTDYWRKLYKLETQTPYLWHKYGYSTGDQLRQVVSNSLNPRKYVRRGVLPTVVQTGARISRTAGQLRGILDANGGRDESIPQLDHRSEKT